ncbi:MAG: substrate-binding protein [Solirubrobacterales bacterium]|nr:substrate-binding protein [Solirubrobacterales bacterium]
MRLTRWASSLLAIGAIGIALASCGSKSKSSTSTSASNSSIGNNQAQTGKAASAAATAGAAAATKEGAPVKLPTKTLGLVNVTAQSEAAQRIQAGAVAAAHTVGWKIITIDAQGDPAKSQAGMTSLLSQNVDAILDLANPTQAINQSLAQARAKNIPVIDIGGIQDPSPNIEATFAVDEKQFTAALDKYMLAHLPANAKIATHTFPLLLSERLRGDQLKSDLTGTGHKVVANHQTDFTSLVADTQKAARAQLNGNPGLTAFWGDTDSQMPAIGQVLKAAGKCGSVQSYNFYDDKVNLQTIAQGCATAIVTSPVDADGWAAVDALAEMWARNKTIADLPKGWASLAPTYGVDIRNGTAIQVIDKSNLPPSGQYVKPKTDFVTFFKTKWAKEFGIK